MQKYLCHFYYYLFFVKLFNFFTECQKSIFFGTLEFSEVRFSDRLR